MKTEKNIYQKIQIVRSELLKSGIKKSGKNDAVGFNYYELSDFLPRLNELMTKYKIMTHFTMSKEAATLEVINTEKPEEKIEFSLPVADVNMRTESTEAEPIQKLGGQVTYMRRYLLQVAFEISEKDIVDPRDQAIPTRPEDDLIQAQVDQIRGAKDLEELSTVAQGIKNSKGFNKEKALLKHYTIKKEELLK